ncbi:hypothetical protein PENTCL1PPCAC_1613, partial [Pristionchus entomophagus]
MKFQESVIFPTFTQALMTVPNASHLTWFALFISQDTPTNVITCTSPKIIASSITFMSFSTITALALSRFLIIVCGIRTGIKFTVISSFIYATPLVVVVVLIHFDGFLYPTNDACQPILFLKLEHLPTYHFYCFLVPSLAVLFNVLTLIYLLHYRYRKSSLKSGTKAFDELHVALSLFVQSVIPFITVGSRAVISLNVVNQYGISIPVEVTKAINMLGCFTTSIIFATFGQFIMSQPFAIYFIFLSFFTGRDIQSTALACTITHNTATALEFGGHLVIPTIAIGRFVGIVLGLNVYALISILFIITTPHFATLYITIFDGIPVPYPDCSPILFFNDEHKFQPYNYYMYFPPLVAVAFNLGTLAYVFWHKSQRGTKTSPERAREEMLVTLGLLAQSIIPAITIISRAYFLWIDFFRTQSSPERTREEMLVTLGLLAQSIVPAITISSRAYLMWIKIF